MRVQSVLLGLVLLVSTTSASMTFAEFKEWLANMSIEERKEYEISQSKNYTEKYGERANELRLCQNVHNNWTSEEMWLEKKWIKESNLRYLDDKRYNDWVVNAPAGSKPWFIAFGDTPFGGPTIVQTMDAVMNALVCISQLYGDEYNVGFMDYKKAEKTHVTYDMVMSYGQQAPYMFIFKEGKAYHYRQGTTSTDKIAKALDNPEQESAFSEPIRPARDELNIYMEYFYKDVGKNKEIGKLTKEAHKMFNETWVDDNIVKPYFGYQLRAKEAGFNIVWLIFAPTLFIGLYITLKLVCCTCRCCCRILCCKSSKKEEGKKKKD